jgi:DNA-binding transcriptional MerR regulator
MKKALPQIALDFPATTPPEGEFREGSYPVRPEGEYAGGVRIRIKSLKTARDANNAGTNGVLPVEQTAFETFLEPVEKAGKETPDLNADSRLTRDGEFTKTGKSLKYSESAEGRNCSGDSDTLPVEERSGNEDPGTVEISRTTEAPGIAEEHGLPAEYPLSEAPGEEEQIKVVEPINTAEALRADPPTGKRLAKSKRGRKSLKQVAAEADLIDIPDDEILFRKQYYSMGEVSDMFRVNQSLLRYWETEFDILQPRKNKKGDRHFRPADVKNLHLIYHLLRQRKYTIEGAKEFLKNNKKANERFEAIQRLQQIKAFLLEWKAQLPRSS